MGEVRVNVKLENDRDLFMLKEGRIRKEELRSANVDALVDTDAVMLVLPQDLVEALGLEKVDRAIVTLADEQKVELDIAGTLALTIAGRTMKTDCLVGPPRSEPLLGQLILERLDLIVDPLRRTLTPRPESPYLPSLKMK